MKKIFIAALTLASVSVYAQRGGGAPEIKNVFLNQAFWKGAVDVNVIKAEIEKGNNPSELNAGAFDPVVLAINNNASVEVIKYLVEQKGNDVKKITHDGRSYLIWASARGNVEVVDYLIKKGSDVHYKDSKGSSAFLFAASGGQKNTKVYDLLLANGVDIKKDVNPDGANALLLGVASDKDLKLSEYFVSKGLSWNSVDAAGNTAFNYAARGGNIEGMQALLKKGIKPTNNAMVMAAQAGRGSNNGLEVFKYLESVQIKPNALGTNGESALSYIVRKPNQDEIINYFLSNGADINLADKEGNNVFMIAAEFNNDVNVISNLLKGVKNINQVNLKGASALLLAAANNSTAVVKLLVEKGADVKTIDKSGDNALAYLVQAYAPNKAADFEGKLNFLIEKGLDVKGVQKNGNSLYHLAVAKNDLKLVKSLAPYKIDLNLKNKEGFTALHKAALIARNTDLLQYLVAEGAKKDIKTEFDETPYDLAKENEYLTKNGTDLEFLK